MKIEGRTMNETTIPERVGLSGIPGQILKKQLQRGLEFNLLVVSETGTGAKTLINSIYNLNAFPPAVQSQSMSLEKTESSITQHKVVLKSNGLSMTLNIFMYRGKAYQEIAEFITARNQKYNKNNIGIKRERIEDPRIHASLFLISPLAFKNEDLQILKALSDLTTVIPVITKRDIFTTSELELYKEKIFQSMQSYKIGITHLIKHKIPILSTIASTTFVTVNEKSVRGREYKWGTLNAEDSELSDLPELIQLLLSQHFIDLKRISTSNYKRWKEQQSIKEPLLLDMQEKELLKEIENTITEKLAEKLKSLEKDEQLIDQAVKSLALPVSKT
ncbi:septin 7 [Nematocida sp. AWRm80]|nr:septin 7 [Nematocida sp. AWRm80]